MSRRSVSGGCRPEAEAEGVPGLQLRDDERELLEDLVADLLISALERSRVEACTANASGRALRWRA